MSFASIKDRRKALGWRRAELAGRAGVDANALAMIERNDWSDDDAIRRVHEVLSRTEAGETDVVLPPPERGEQDTTFGAPPNGSPVGADPTKP